MALEQELRLIPITVDGGAYNGTEIRPPLVDGGDDGSKIPRLPRWTRQEILVLIQGKKVAENRVRRGRTAGMAFGSGQVEPKWASVSSYCKRHGVNRGPVQCRKRWSNLAGDFKKIKEWESQIREETESFWVMRNDLRREKKLPGFFDREVYDILDGTGSLPAIPPGLNLALAPANQPAEETEAVFDSGRTTAAEDGLFSDFEQEETGVSPQKEAEAKDVTPLKSAIPAPIPISEKQYQPSLQTDQAQGNDKQPASTPVVASASHDTLKRKRVAADGDDETTAAATTTTNLEKQLVDVLEKNGKMLTAQLEAQNIGLQLDREQRKDHADSLVAVLNKLADALGKIADKL
ncbi:trihelix transcription factor ASR3 [Euphorbia lathyris]|uniref:trihelix transcription factor ASR3 n=1 Tax=Euphorbia lathyris TaxID=212925 RepID=UPI0033135CE8